MGRMGRVVTGRIMGDPPPWRAGRAPDCEEARVAAQRALARRLLGTDGAENDPRVLALLADQERLAPRRYRPQQP